MPYGQSGLGIQGFPGTSAGFDWGGLLGTGLEAVSRLLIPQLQPTPPIVAPPPGIPGVNVPGISVGPGGLAIGPGTPTAPNGGAMGTFRGGGTCPARPLPIVRVVNPDTGRETYYRHVGTPKTFSLDGSIVRRLEKDSRRIQRLCGRRPR